MSPRSYVIAIQDNNGGADDILNRSFAADKETEFCYGLETFIKEPYGIPRIRWPHSSVFHLTARILQ